MLHNRVLFILSQLVATSYSRNNGNYRNERAGDRLSPPQSREIHCDVTQRWHRGFVATELRREGLNSFGACGLRMGEPFHEKCAAFASSLSNALPRQGAAQLRSKTWRSLKKPFMPLSSG